MVINGDFKCATKWFAEKEETEQPLNAEADDVHGWLSQTSSLFFAVRSVCSRVTAITSFAVYYLSRLLRITLMTTLQASCPNCTAPFSFDNTFSIKLPLSGDNSFVPQWQQTPDRPTLSVSFLLLQTVSTHTQFFADTIADYYLVLFASTIYFALIFPFTNINSSNSTCICHLFC